MHARLQTVLLRRTKQSTINGEPIIKLPGREQRLVREKFSAQEAAFYQQVRPYTACNGVAAPALALVGSCRNNSVVFAVWRSHLAPAQLSLPFNPSRATLCTLPAVDKQPQRTPLSNRTLS